MKVVVTIEVKLKIAQEPNVLIVIKKETVKININPVNQVIRMLFGASGLGQCAITKAPQHVEEQRVHLVLLRVIALVWILCVYGIVHQNDAQIRVRTVATEAVVVETVMVVKPFHFWGSKCLFSSYI